MVDDIPKIHPDPQTSSEPSPSAKVAIAQAQAKAESDSAKAAAENPGTAMAATMPPAPPPPTRQNIAPGPDGRLPRSEALRGLPRKGIVRDFPRWAKIVSIVVGIFILLGIAITIPAFKTLQTAKNTLATAREAYTAGKNQNLPEFNQKLTATHDQLLQTHKSYRLLIWTKAIPVLNWYYNDGDHAFKAAIAGSEAAQILGTTLEPYADVLGFQGQGSFTGGTAEDRITKIVETLDKVTPEIDRVAEKIKIADEELSKINPNHYPFTVKGHNLKESITDAQSFAHEALVAVTDAKPVLEILPEALGIREEKKYAVLFQNDAELRATGGFMTAYGILRVDKGKVFQEKSDDIYNLDSKFQSRLKPPELIDRYLPNVFYWYLRDMNLSPDFKESMDTFYEHYQDIPGEPEVDGIIAVDTQVLSDLVSILGPIDVPGFGTFSSESDPRCDCPQIIYELEDMASRPVAYVKTDRKGFLAPMLQTILLKAYGSPKNLWPGLFQTMTRDIAEKHALFYLFDEKEQQAIEGINVAGRIQDYDSDYFHVNDLNLGGAKSNMFITEEVVQEITISDDGTVSKKVTITYKNPASASNCNLEAGELCLNGILRNVMRLYVPQGSQLKEALGFEQDSTETYEDLGKTVFQGFFTLSPQNQSKVVFQYSLPFKVEGNEYHLLIQKQPGKKKPQYTVTINNEHQEEFELASDKELKIKLN